MPLPIGRAARLRNARLLRIGRVPRAVVLALSLVLAVGCGGDRDGGGAAAPPASSPAALPVPSRPDDLAAHVVVAAPRTVLPLLRDGLGDAAAALPGSFAAGVVSIADLPITAAEVVEDDAPLVASLLASEAGLEVVVAVHVRSTDRLAAIATAGADAPFRGESGEGGATRLVPVRPRPGGLHLAVLGNHLLLATSDGAIDRAGAFTERAPAPALREGELVALEHGPSAPLLARRLAARWLARPPATSAGPSGDFGLDPSRLLAEIEPAFDALAGGRTSLRIERARLRVDVAAGDSLVTRLGAAALPSSAAESFLALPKDAAIAVLFHRGGGGAEPILPSAELAAATGLEGARAEAVADAMTKLERSRAPAVAVGAGAAPGGPALWFGTPLTDVPAARDALSALVKAVGEKAKKERPSVTARSTVVERVGDVVRLRVRPTDREDATPVDVYLRVEDATLLGATGLDAVEALQALRDGAPSSRLSAEPIAVDLAASAPTHHALALVDLGGLDASLGRKPRARRAVLGASFADRDGVPSLRLLLEPAALSALREKLGAP